MLRILLTLLALPLLLILSSLRPRLRMARHEQTRNHNTAESGRIIEGSYRRLD